MGLNMIVDITIDMLKVWEKEIHWRIKEMKLTHV